MTPESLADLHARCFDVPRPWNAGEFRELLKDGSVFLCEHKYGFAFGRVVAGDDGYHRRGRLRHRAYQLATVVTEYAIVAAAGS